jgi:hypothetical protein
MNADVKPSSGHTMRVTLDYDIVRLIPVCHEPEGAVCRVMCAAKDPCESFGYPDHEHGLKSVDYCNAVEYLTSEDSVEERCSNKGETALHDGMSIEVEWDGDGYTWSAIKSTTKVTP